MIAPTLVHTPYKLIDQSRRPAIIYAHGGGVIGCTALSHKRYLAKLASTCNVVIFKIHLNVKNRLIYIKNRLIPRLGIGNGSTVHRGGRMAITMV